MMNSCLFCNKQGPYTKLEHIIPESLGNDDLMLQNEVCDHCNEFFGRKVERFVLGKTPLGFWRTLLGIKTKKKKLPHIDLSQPRRQRGRMPAVHPLHDNLVGFTCHSDYSTSVDIENDQMTREILDGKRNRFTFVFTPHVLFMMGRFLCKVGVELACYHDSQRARSEMFARARAFSRFGDFDGLWPIFHFQSSSLKELKEQRLGAQGVVEEVFCYHYRLLEFSDIYTLLTLAVGADTWIVCLNDPYPKPAIRAAFPNQDLNLIWYSPEQVKSKENQQFGSGDG